MQWLTVASQSSAAQLAVLILSTIVTVDAVRRFIRSYIDRKGHPLPPGTCPASTSGQCPLCQYSDTLVDIYSLASEIW